MVNKAFNAPLFFFCLTLEDFLGQIHIWNYVVELGKENCITAISNLNSWVCAAIFFLFLPKNRIVSAFGDSKF